MLILRYFRRVPVFFFMLSREILSFLLLRSQLREWNFGTSLAMLKLKKRRGSKLSILLFPKFLCVALLFSWLLAYMAINRNFLGDPGDPGIQMNLLGCRKSGKMNIGLLLTKDDGDILRVWFEKNSRYFSALVILDGSIESDLAKQLFSNCKRAFYYHESNFTQLKVYSDGELRALGHELVTKLFGYDVWITMAHSDEFYYHSPLKIIEKAERENADFVKWQALHILPNPSEYEYYLQHPGAPVTELFKHYYHFGPQKGAFLESRMFFSKPELQWNNRQGLLLPLNLKRELSVHPSYMHYKVHNLTTAAYTANGIHKTHWNRVSRVAYKNPTAKPGVGIRWNISSTRDFFVHSFPNSKKYDHISVLRNNRIEKYLDIGEEYKDEEPCIPESS